MKLTHLFLRNNLANLCHRNLAWRFLVPLAALVLVAAAPAKAFAAKAATPTDMEISEVTTWPNGMMAPPLITITFKFNDTTAGATIHGTSDCTGGWSGPDFSGASGIEEVFDGPGTGGDCVVTYYATAPGFTQSDSAQLTIN
jgi:hypothetical protein